MVPTRNPAKAARVQALGVITLTLAFACTSVQRAQSADVNEAIRIIPISEASRTQDSGVLPKQPIDPRTTRIGTLVRDKLRDLQMTLDQRQSLADLRRRQGEDIRVRMRPGVGTPSQIKGQLLQPSEAGSGSDRSTAQAFLRANQKLLGIDEADSEFAFQQRITDHIGYRHLRFSQSYVDLPVWPAELTVHLAPEGHVYLMNGSFVPTPRRVVTQPVIDEDAAILLAHAEIDDAGESQEANQSSSSTPQAIGHRGSRGSWSWSPLT